MKKILIFDLIYMQVEKKLSEISYIQEYFIEEKVNAKLGSS